MYLSLKSIKTALAITWVLISFLCCPLSIKAQTNTPTPKPSNQSNSKNPTKSTRWRKKTPLPPASSGTWRKKAPAPPGSSSGPPR